MLRSWPAAPTETGVARSATEPLPSATLLSAVAVASLPIATACAPDATALSPTAVVFRPVACAPVPTATDDCAVRSEEHTSELQSLMRISYAVFCLKKKNQRHVTPKQ